MSEAKNLVFGGAECPTFNDQFFCNVRSFYGIADDFANDSFTFDNLKSGGGKGGDPMVRTTDLLFFVKQLNPGDHQVLVDPAFAQAFSAHITNAELPSVIGPIVAHFSNPNTRKNYMVMLNVLSYDGQYHKQYDLKGCADDRLLVNDGERIVVVRKRIWSLHVRCGCGGPLRKIYKDGKLEALHQPFLPISEADKKLLLEALERDVKFLQENELMDYSLIVGVVKRDAASADGNLNKDTLTADSELYAGKPLVSFHHEQETVLLYVSNALLIFAFVNHEQHSQPCYL